MQKCPNQATTMAQLWREKDDEFKVIYKKEDITKDRKIQWKKFMTSLKHLSRNGFVIYRFNPFTDTITIYIYHSDEALAC
jgi:hypothetical protein